MDLHSFSKVIGDITLMLKTTFLQRALYEKLARRRNRLNLSGSSSSEREEGQAQQASAFSATDAKEQMQKDFAAGIRSLDTYRANMALSRMLRADDAKRKPALILLREYPALTIKELVNYLHY